VSRRVRRQRRRTVGARRPRVGDVDLVLTGEIIHWFRTSLFLRADLYLVPLKVAVRRAEGVELGDVVTVRLHLDT
jgi:hypothetical protein